MKKKFKPEPYRDYKDVALYELETIHYNVMNLLDDNSKDNPVKIKTLKRIESIYFMLSTQLSNTVSEQDWDDMNDFLKNN